MSRAVLILAFVVVGAGLAVGGLPASFLPAPQDPPVAEPQDPPKFPDELVSWYKITQDGEHVGYAHTEMTASIGPEGGFTIEHEEDAEIRVGKLYVPYSEKTSVVLDDDFQATRLETNVNIVGVFDVRVQMSLGEEGQRYTVRVGDQTPTEFEQADGFYTNTDLLLYRWMREGVLQTGARIPVELLGASDKQLQKCEVTFIVEGPVPLKVMGQEKPSTVTLIHVEGDPAPVPELRTTKFYLDCWGRIVQLEFQGGLMYTLVANAQEARGNDRRVALQGRRDPFRKDIPMQTAKDEEGDALGGDRVSGSTKVTSKEVDEKLLQLKALVTEMETLKKSRGDVRKAYLRYVEHFVPLRERLKEDKATEKLQKIDEERDRVEKEIYDGSQRAYDEANRVFLRIVELSKTDELAAMEKEIEVLKKFQSLPELVARPEAQKVETELVANALKKLERCKNRKILKEKKLVVTGTIELIRQFPARLDLNLDLFGERFRVKAAPVLIRVETMALINDQTVRVGDVVQGQDVKVESISRDLVEVSYKGEIRPIPLQ